MLLGGPGPVGVALPPSAAADPAPAPTESPASDSPAAGTSIPADTPAPPAALDATTKELSDRIGVAMRRRIELVPRQQELEAQRATRAAALAALDVEVAQVSTQLQQAVADLDVAKDHMRQLALEAYKNRGAPRMVELLATATSAKSFGFGAEMLRRADAAQATRADDARTRRDVLVVRLGDASTRRATVSQDVGELDAQLAETSADLARAEGSASAASAALEDHLPDVIRPGTPILGDPELTAPQLLAWYRSTGSAAHLDIDISELIDDYLSEGRDEHVRGDVAFVQSIVETGYFSFPGNGQVGVADHNFAGIGACDSCSHGDHFADAREGVRAQMQLLHFYADATMTEARLAHPAVRHLDKLGVKGCCPTWYSLTGTWATAPTYGPVILALLDRVATFTP